MSENDLLQRLVALSREQEGLDEGAAVSEADSEGASEAAPKADDQDALHAPLDEAARARIAARVTAHVAAQAREAEPEGAKIIPISRRRKSAAAVFAVVAAAAAAAVVLWPRAPVTAPLPLYALSVTGGRAESRHGGAAEGELRQLGAGDRLDIVLRPATALDGAVVARVFVKGPASGLRAVSIEPEISPEGAIRVQGGGDQLLPVPAGRYELLVAVARDPAALEVAGLAARLEGAQSGLQRFAIPVERIGDAGGEAGELAFAGCARLFRGQRCQLLDTDDKKGSDARTTLTLWLPTGGEGAATMRLDGRPVTPEAREVGGGAQYQLEVGEGASWLEVVTVQPVEAAYAIELLSAVPPALAESVARAEALGQEARAAWREGDGERAIARLDEAVAKDREAMCRSCESGDLAAQAFMLVQSKRFADADERLAAWSEIADEYPPARAELGYSVGLVALERGDVRTALATLEDAERAAERLGMGRYRAAIQGARADALQRLGRRQEAIDIMHALLPAAGEAPCDRARVLGNMAWAALGADQPEGLGLELRATLEEALALHASSSCPAGSHANTLVNLAAIELRDGAPAAAEARLAEALEVVPEPAPWLKVWILELEAQIALARGQADAALARFEQLGQLAEVVADPALAWRAAVGVASVWDESATPDGRARAVAAYARAEELVDAASIRVPLTAGRETFAADRARASRQHVAALLALGRTDEAFAAARRARTRVLAGLRRTDRVASLDAAARAAWDQAIAAYQRGRDRLDAEAGELWRLPGDQLAAAQAARADEVAKLREELDRGFAVLAQQMGAADASRSLYTPRSPAPGELMLLGFPLADEWAVFAADADQVTVHRMPGPEAGRTDEQLAADLLTPIADRVARAQQVTVMPYGAMRAVDVHALPWQGQPLMAQVPVVYGLDIASASAAALGEEPASTAGSAAGAAPDGTVAGAPVELLVVADPREDLPAARREGAAVAEAARGYARLAYLRGAEATGPAVRDALAAADMFHYAGHGRFAGRGGWQSALALAGSSELTVGDILTLPRVPRYVVLAGCETARGDELAAEGLGLGQAFVAAGARQVIASARPVDDALTAALAADLHRALAAGEGADELHDLIAGLRQAQLALRARAASGDDWRAFRVLVP